MKLDPMKILERMANEMPMKNCFRSERDTRGVEGLLNKLRSASDGTRERRKTEDRLLGQGEKVLQFSFVIVHHRSIECFGN